MTNRTNNPRPTTDAAPQQPCPDRTWCEGDAPGADHDWGHASDGFDLGPTTPLPNGDRAGWWCWPSEEHGGPPMLAVEGCHPADDGSHTTTSSLAEVPAAAVLVLLEATADQHARKELLTLARTLVAEARG